MIQTWARLVQTIKKNSNFVWKIVQPESEAIFLLKNPSSILRRPFIRKVSNTRLCRGS